jgi:hypothetical protein
MDTIDPANQKLLLNKTSVAVNNLVIKCNT